VTALARLAAALAARSARERWLLAVAGAVVAVAIAAAAALAVRDDLALLRARVAGRERELAAVRRLAATLRAAGPPPATDEEAAALLPRLEAAAEAAVGRERIARMTPAGAAASDAAERVELAVRDASLAEVVRLLHALEAGTPPLGVARLELRKHVDQPTRFEATVEVVRGGVR
jgi:hypothetical protein